jgi:predicted metalloprotease
MRIDNERESSNIEDRRGGIPGGKGGLGLGAIVIALVAVYFGADPRAVLQGLTAGSANHGSARQATGPVQASPQEEKERHLVAVVLADTEDTWGQIFKNAGRTYREPKLVLYRDSTPTACGGGQTAMGPFYCPGDEKVYLDLGFYDELQSRYQAPGQFAQAYVVAHEIGHHVQKLLGISDKVHALQARGSKAQANALSVRLELQADCLAGIWANQANRSRHILEEGDIESALTAAAAVGDDRLQQQAHGYVVPESFTHGSSAQRVQWFKQGMNSGNFEDCDTFRAR